MNSKISIIVPVYNSEKYLDACISSILAQIYTNLEIIIINDGSTDSSLNICKTYARKDPRIILLSQKNLGQAVARNKGLEIATGEYIAFVDSDDTISNNLFFENIKILNDDTSIDFIQFPRFVNYGTVNKKLIKSNLNQTIYEDFFYKNWLEDKVISWIVCDKIFRKELFSSIRFQEGMIFEDNYLIADILDVSKKIYVSIQGIYFYWWRSDSTTTQKHSLKQDIDTLKVSLHILGKIKDIKNAKKAKIIILSRIFYVYSSIFKLFNYRLEFDELFIKEFNKISLFSLIKSNLPCKQILKLLIVKIIGVKFHLNKLIECKNI